MDYFVFQRIKIVFWHKPIVCLKNPFHIYLPLLICSADAATYFAFSHQFNAALLLVLAGVFFDFFDGFFARILKVESDLGVQLDSMTI